MDVQDESIEKYFQDNVNQLKQVSPLEVDKPETDRLGDAQGGQIESSPVGHEISDKEVI